MSRPVTFAGVFDPRRPPGAEVSALRRAVGGADAATWAHGPLALAWTTVGGSRSAVAPEDGPQVFVFGEVHEPSEAAGDDRGEAPGLTQLLRREGDRLLDRLRGDFVLLLFDPAREQIAIVRDQLGGGSACWVEHRGRVTFASEVAPLLRMVPSRPCPDVVGVSHWLAMSAPPHDTTLHEGVHRLPPAHRLDLGAGVARARPYWRPRYRPPDPLDHAAAAAGLRNVLTTAIRRRSRRPGATGILLSGGLDSSTVAALATTTGAGHRIERAYSAVFPDHPTVDERDLIDLLGATLGLAGTHVVVRGGSVIGGALEYLRHWELPPTSPNLFFWMPLLRQAAADGVTVVLDGEGGDELFGASPYLIADRLIRGHLLGAIDLVRRLPGGGRHLSRRTIWRYLREFGIKGALPGAAHHRLRRLRRATNYVPEWLRSDAAAAYLDTDPSAAWKRIGEPRWWSFLVHAVVEGTAPAITRDHVRRRSGLCGVDASHPLLDVEVVDYVLALPPELAFEAQHSRPLLRAATAGVLRDEVRLRGPKSSFDAVFHEALAGPDLAVARRLLDPRRAQVGSYVDLDLVQARLLRAPPGPAHRQWWALQLWRLVTAECWLQAEAGGIDALANGLDLVPTNILLIRAGEAGDGGEL